MPNSFQLKVTGLDDLAKKIKGVEAKAAIKLGKALQQGVLYIHQNIPPYPSRSGVPAVKFTTEKQRRYFFWALRKGKIEVPYRRTMTLGRSFTTFKGGSQGALSEVKTGKASLQAVIGTSMPYAQHVVGEKQAPMHKGRWFKLINEIEKHLPKVTQHLQATIDRLLKG